MHTAPLTPESGVVSRQDLSTDDEAPQPRRDAQKLARSNQANDWKWQMSTKQGRRVVWRLLGEAGVFRSSFTGNSETFFREGKRALGLHMLEQIQTHCADTFGLMQQEAIQ